MVYRSCGGRSQFSTRYWHSEVSWPVRPQTSHVRARSDEAKGREGSASRKLEGSGILREKNGVGAKDWEAGEEETVGNTKETGD